MSYHLLEFALLRPICLHAVHRFQERRPYKINLRSLYLKSYILLRASNLKICSGEKNPHDEFAPISEIAQGCQGGTRCFMTYTYVFMNQP